MNLKEIIRSSNPYRMLKSSRGFFRWSQASYAAPSPHFVKRAVILRNAFSRSTWVETGTYLGGMTKELSSHGEFVYSIEPEPTLYSNAAAFFESYSNVEIIEGLSEEVFPSLLSKISGDINFWLDGHYSGGITHKGPRETPILEELAQISKNLNRFGKVCVMIDDVRCFNPDIFDYASYPSVNVLIEWSIQNSLSWHIEHDIFVAKSRPAPSQS